jgi:hypothetical protein
LPFTLTATGLSSSLIAEVNFTDAMLQQGKMENWNDPNTWTLARTGTISATNGSPTVTGAGTFFLTELSPGGCYYKR